MNKSSNASTMNDIIEQLNDVSIALQAQCAWGLVQDIEQAIKTLKEHLNEHQCIGLQAPVVPSTLGD